MKTNIEVHYRHLVQQKGGYKVLHAHLDKSNIVTPQILDTAQKVSMQDKWHLFQKIKDSYTYQSVYNRAEIALHKMIKQKVPLVRTFVDADPTVGQMCIDALVNLKHDYKSIIDIEIAIQPLEGVVSLPARKAFEIACKKADLVGGLPSRDSDPKEHIRILFDIASSLNLPVDLHIDQLNDPDEIETQLLLEVIEETSFTNKVNAVHCISLSAKDSSYQEEICQRLNNHNVGVIICPSAALSMKPVLKNTTTHNSIAPLQILHQNNVQVALGVDNIHDLFMPLVDGDMWFESRLLMEATRCYDLNLISDIATRYI